MKFSICILWIAIVISSPFARGGSAGCASPYISDGFGNDDGISVAKIGPVVFLGQRHQHEISVYDASNEHDPVLVNSIDLPDECVSISLQWPLLYAATRKDGISVFDVTNPLSVTPLGEVETEGYAQHMVVVGHTGYVANSLRGLQIFDLESSAKPSLIAEYALDSSPALALDVRDGVAGVGFGDVFALIDVSDPSNAVLVGSYPVGNMISAVALAENFAVVGTSDLPGSGSDLPVSVIDLSNPAGPILVGEHPIYGNVTDLDLVGNTLYVTSKTQGLLRFDASNPHELIEEAKLSFSYDAISTTIEGSRAYVAHAFRGFSTVDLDAMRTPRLDGFIDELPFAANIEREGDFLYLSNYTDGFMILDDQYPQGASVLGAIDIRVDEGDEMLISGGYAYLQTPNGVSEQIDIVDVRDPTTPTLVSSIPTESGLSNFVLQGGYLFAAEGYPGGLRVYDVTDPGQPTEVSSIDSHHAYSVFVEGTVAFVTANLNKLYRYDITDPAHPVELGVQYLDPDPGQIKLHDGYAYIVQDRLGIYRVMEDGELVLASTIDLPQGTVDDFTVVQGRLYIVSGAQGLYIYDVRDPSLPTRLTQYIMPNRRWLYDLEVRGDRLELPVEYRGVMVLDISDLCGGACAVDLDGDGAATFFDVSAFLTAYLSQDAVADFNDDEIINFFDVSAFIVAFTAGCP